jgi:hypothetical protein
MTPQKDCGGRDNFLKPVDYPAKRKRLKENLRRREKIDCLQIPFSIL